LLGPIWDVRSARQLPLNRPDRRSFFWLETWNLLLPGEDFRVPPFLLLFFIFFSRKLTFWTLCRPNEVCGPPSVSGMVPSRVACLAPPALGCYSRVGLRAFVSVSPRIPFTLFRLAKLGSAGLWATSKCLQTCFSFCYAPCHGGGGERRPFARRFDSGVMRDGKVGNPGFPPPPLPI